MKTRLVHIIFCISWIIPLMYSCSQNESINVAETIHKYNLHYQTVPAGDVIDNSLHGDGSLFGVIHYNKRTDSCLYVLKNFKNDTLLIHLDRGLDNYWGAQVIRQKDNYFFLFRDFGKTAQNITTTPNIKESYRLDNYIKFFKIDTISRNMTQIKRTPDVEIIDSIKKYFNLQGDFHMVHPPLEDIERFDYSKINALITIAKDTLDNYQSYYLLSPTFEPEKRGKSFKLSPNFNGINHLGIFKDNISYWEENIGNTKEASIKYKYYYYYLNPIDSSYSKYKKLHKIEVISHYNNRENIVVTLKEEDLFKLNSEKEIEKNVGIIFEFRPVMFRYHNVEYFISTFLPRQDEYIENSPPIYHLDTVKWRINKIELFDPLVDKKYSNLQRKVPVEITGNYRDASLFLESFEIVKVNDEYRLIKKGI